ncbi:MAG: 2Fe-2S iron-sulfur cluster-binding protein [Candidatus Thiodiazotropha sp.]
MTTGALALLIGTLILVQILLALWLKLRRRRAEANNPASDITQPRISTPQQSGMPPQESGAAWTGFRAFRVVKREIENATGDIVSFYLAPEQPMPLPAYKPGQFLSVRVELPDGTESGAQTLTRCYSLSDRPHSDQYRISVKQIPGGQLSTHLHEKITVGSRLMVKAPSGAFQLIQKPPRPQVLIAGGIGITPMLSMLYALLDQGYEQDIWLFYGARNSREGIMLPRLRELAEYHPQFHLNLCYSRPDPKDRPGIDFQYAGHIDTVLLQRELPLNHYRFYLCGPAALMENLVPGLEALGVSEADIHFEAFGPSTLKRTDKTTQPDSATESQSWQVNFQSSGKSLAWSGAHENLLSLIEAEGIAVDTACRSGSCGSCQTRIESGSVIYDQTPDAEIQEGHCLLCVGRPGSDLSLAL